MTSKMAELEIGLRPNVGWVVSIFRNGRNEGPTHNGYFADRGGAKREAERAAASMRKRGINVHIQGGFVQF